MIIIMHTAATEAQISAVQAKVEKLGFTPHVISGVVKTVIAAVGEGNKEPLKSLEFTQGVDKVMPIQHPYKLASRSTKEEDTVLDFGDVKVGGENFTIFAGPCSVETDEQMDVCAAAVKASGAQFLRGGAFKPRTSPYSFQGHGEKGLKMLKAAGDAHGLKTITELVQPSDADLVADYVDMIQIGARNMQNFPLLKEVGRVGKPVFLKRGLCATLEELLMAAEYVLAAGNTDIVICERGIRTFEKAYRNTLDLNAVPALQKQTHLPVIADPAHGTGRRDMVSTMAKASVAAGASGIMVEIHPDPDQAWSDGPQSLTLEQYAALVEELKPFIAAANKNFAA